MKTKIEWEHDIMNIINTIHQKFPELCKYMTEMPVEGSEKDGINVKNLEDYYHSLEEVVNKYAKTHNDMNNQKKNETPLFPGYPHYPPSEDIYQQGKKEMDINPEDLSKRKTPNETKGSLNEKDFEDDMSGNDLDVPGSELDDQQESIGSEDEENNYYSLGGDNHNNLEEDNG